MWIHGETVVPQLWNSNWPATEPLQLSPSHAASRVSRSRRTRAAFSLTTSVVLKCEDFEDFAWRFLGDHFISAFDRLTGRVFPHLTWIDLANLVPK